MEKKSYISIKASAGNSRLELFFTDFIVNQFDWETWEVSNMVQDTIDRIKAANPSSIKITINSLGGDVMIGLAIYNYLKSLSIEVEVEVIGFAGSIASIMAMSASPGKLKMARNSFMIIHAAWTSTSGNAKSMRDQADTLDLISGELADIYALRSGKEASYFTDMWADGSDIWLTAKEAKNMGLVDELTNATPVSASINLDGYGFKNIPDNIRNQFTQNQYNMAFPKTLATVNAQSLAVVDGGFLMEEAHLNAIEAKLIAADTQAETLAEAQASVTSLNEQITAHEATIASLEQKETEKDSKIAELNATIVALGKKASGNGTNMQQAADEGEQPPVPSYAAADSPINAWVDEQLKYQTEPQS